MADTKRKDSELTTSLTNKNAQLESSKPTQLDYTEFKLPDVVNQAYEKVNSLHQPVSYNATWLQSMNDTMNKYLNRDPFSYDVTGDALYQQYKDQYVTQGQMAMMDTMGQAAAMTGGYGNSYAQSVGQQAYQGYLQQLTDKVPELYKLALDKYNQEGEALLNQYGLIADADNREYSRNRDDISDYYTNRDYYTNQANTLYDRAYNEWYNNWNMTHTLNRDAVSDWQYDLGRNDNLLANSQRMDEERYQFDTTQGYNENQAVKNEAYSLLQSGVMPSNDMLAKAGIDSATAKALQKAATTAAASSSSSGKNGSTKSVTTGDVDDIIDNLDGITDENERAKRLGLYHQLGAIDDDTFEALLAAYGFALNSNLEVVTTDVLRNENIANGLGTNAARAETIAAKKRLQAKAQ